ncbi:MAG: hypothetical protein E7311_03045 [Clostridiales bacterium]|nr:hypothetical protein [Clostridiales bacterium]
MGTYFIPRNTKGETRLFKIFSVKALIYTVVMVIPGLLLKLLVFDTLGFGLAGWIAMGVFGAIGFVVGTFKIPNLTLAPIFKVCAGENIDDIILRYIKFRTKDKKIYIYGKEKK